LAPLTILGSLDDGLGRGIDKLAVKSVLDGFASMAFAASFGIGVLASALSVLVIQGALTIVGIFLGTIMPAAQIAALTATGGLVLAGIGLRLLRIRQIPVGDMLPALVGGAAAHDAGGALETRRSPLPAGVPERLVRHGCGP
jgi:uncharacterized membrane protein YqgA involved in biofilm formation